MEEFCFNDKGLYLWYLLIFLVMLFYLDIKFLISFKKF